ncbi:hypothetical protein FALBO_9890 [Fusarium albosuccineum]|uniref:Uncharacterized protein n=1 Tax=Fusarium albosuccineum TaxID=1237068 RepID=A0A8H4L8Y7_9HYPO|nr:hypothetical protein FALBO_9890 [Fusarium albosuccineum]
MFPQTTRRRPARTSSTGDPLSVERRSTDRRHFSRQRSRSRPPSPAVLQILDSVKPYAVIVALLTIFSVLLSGISGCPPTPLPIHKPLVKVTSSLRETFPPSNYSTTYIPGSITDEYERWIKDMCRCPEQYFLATIGGKSSEKAPGKLHSLDDVRMKEVSFSCLYAINDASELKRKSREIIDIIKTAHSDGLNAIESATHQVYHLQEWQENPSSRNTAFSDNDWVMNQYFSILGTHVAEKRIVKPNGAEPLAQITTDQEQPKDEKVSADQDSGVVVVERLRLYSLGMVASRLSDFSNFTTSLNSRVASLQNDLQPLLNHPRNLRCRTDGLRQLSSLRNTTGKYSHLASEQAKSVRELVTQIDALRLSLKGFLGRNVEWDRDRYPHRDISLANSTINLRGDHWNATWAWMELGTDSQVSPSLASLTSAICSRISCRMHRHSVRLPTAKIQLAELDKELVTAYREAGQEWYSLISVDNWLKYHHHIDPLE